MSAAAHVVLVHGLWGGHWVWDGVAERLAAAAVASSAPDLTLRSLEADVAVVTELLDRLDAPVVLAGHSYGGAVITAAGAHPCVRQLVYLAAFQLDAGESVSRVLPQRGLAPSEMDVAMRSMVRGDQVIAQPEIVGPLLYNRTAPAVADGQLARMRPVAKQLFRGRPAQVAWRTRPSTYVVCTDDRTVSPALQRAMAERATRVVELDTDHCPMNSRPDDVAALLIGLSAPAAG